jgi:adenylate cyclase
VRTEKDQRRFWIYLIGALLTSGLGYLLTFPLGDGLARLSYDLPFAVQNGGPTNAVLVFINDQAKKNLGEPPTELDRRFHAQLTERLHADGAKLIFFDLICFDIPNRDPAVDTRFLQAMKDHGLVVLVAPQLPANQMNTAIEVIMPILPEFATNAAGWGLANVDPDGDGAMRKLPVGNDTVESGGWVAARLLGAPETRNDAGRLRERWLNYYGPPGSIPAVNYDHALQTDGLPPGFFRGKIVVVCAGTTIGVAGSNQDEFRNPYGLWGARPSFGGEVQALTILNLIQGDWLQRLGHKWEVILVIGWGFLCAFGLSGRRPWTAALCAMAAVVLIVVVSTTLQLKQHLWWNWMIPVVLTPVALIWSVGYQYVVEFRRRRHIRRALAIYVSPYMADQIADSQFDLALGGTEVEATVMFTDLEGFTKMSETLAPAEVSKILTTYFNETTRAILEQDGMIIKYIGDAVMAVWGAPLAEPQHAKRAVSAAWGMNQAGKKEIHGRRLRTRIGINTGTVLAGNLGSDFRFDYTLIGDTTNFASRLEGLNKYLRTDILISEFTLQQLDETFKVRPLGRFLVPGKVRSIAIYEVLGPRSEFSAEPLWLDPFSQALECFTKREFDEAVRLLQRTIDLREGKDGPAEFYLKEITKARAATEPPSKWDGTVILDSK